MAVKELFTKYKLYTIIFIVIMVLTAIGIILGIFLSKTKPSTIADTYNDFEYTVSGNQATITGYTGSATTLIIPSSINEYTVTSIGSNAFADCTSIESLEIPESITSIGASAFSGCSGLNSVYINDLVSWCNIGFFGEANPLINGADLYLNDVIVTDLVIPNSIVSIRNYSFLGCTSLTSLTIPNSVTSIGSNSFGSCVNLNSVSVGNGVTSINYNAFNGCNNLASVYITELTAWCNIDFAYFTSNPLSYGADLYLNNNLVTNLTVPNGITSIKDYAFYGCTSLISVDLPTSVESIGNSAFEYCGSLISIDIPESVQSIGNSAFYRCVSLISVTIPNGVTSIGNYTFSNCFSLTSVELPDSVTSINDFAFYLCSNLTSITIPENVESIGESAFQNCTDLTFIYFNNDITLDEYMIGSNAFSGGNHYVQYYFKDQTNLENAINVHGSKFTTNESGSLNTLIMQWYVMVNCNQNCGTLEYVEPSQIIYGTKITATVIPKNVVFLYWQVTVMRNGVQIVKEQITSPTFTYTITDLGNYAFTAVFDIGISITSINDGVEFAITNESIDEVVHSYVIQTNSGYFINGICITNSSTEPTANEFIKINSTNGNLGNDYCTAIHYMTNTEGTKIVLEIYNINEPFTIYLDFRTTTDSQLN